MIGYVILILVFGMLVLIAIGSILFGLIKKRKSFWITGVILFVVGVTGVIISGLAYAKGLVDYVASKEFQADARKGSTLLGQTVGSVSSGLSKGISSTLDDTAIADLAKKSANILRKSMKTIASGLDSTIGNKQLFIDQPLADAGIELGRAVEQYHSNTSELGIFISYQKDFKGKLKLINYDQNGKKVDIALREVNVKSGTERVEEFVFSRPYAGLTTYYILSKAD